MGGKAATRVTIESGSEDPLESVRHALAFADEMVTLGADIVVTGDLYMTVRFPEEILPERPDRGHGGESEG